MERPKVGPGHAHDLRARRAEAGRGRGAGHIRVARGHAGGDRRVRRRDGRPPVDPRRPGARQADAVRRRRSRTATTRSRWRRCSTCRSTRSSSAFGVNYGLNKVRFPAPLPVGGRVRMRAKLNALEEVPGGAQMTRSCTFEREGGDKPVCVAETSCACTRGPSTASKIAGVATRIVERRPLTSPRRPRRSSGRLAPWPPTHGGDRRARRTRCRHGRRRSEAARCRGARRATGAATWARAAAVGRKQQSTARPGRALACR